MTGTKDERVWGVPTEGCRLSLAAGATTVPLGSPVVLSLVFSNDGQTPIEFPRVSIWFEYEYSVVSGDGKPVQLTPFGQQKLRSMKEQGGTLLEFQPGSRTTSTVEISRLYDLSRPGEYAIQATKSLLNHTGDGYIKVVSNTITVEVEEGPQ